MMIDSEEYIEYSGNQVQIGENPYDDDRSMFNVQQWRHVYRARWRRWFDLHKVTLAIFGHDIIF